MTSFERDSRLAAGACSALILSLAIAAEGCGSAHADSCIPYSSGHDTSFANASLGVYFGRAWCETFLATDTVITAISVWVPGGTPSAAVSRLYVLETQVDEYGVLPDPLAVLLTGPQHGYPDSGESPVRVRFELDPPLSLPDTGWYAFAIKEDHWSCSLFYPLLLDTLNGYAGGTLHLIYPTNDCTLSPAFTPYFDWDLIFEIEYCRTDAVQTREETWGRLKAHYR